MKSKLNEERRKAAPQTSDLENKKSIWENGEVAPSGQVTPDAAEMREWWNWYGRVAEAIRTREVIVQKAERALAFSPVAGIVQRVTIERIARQIDALERDAIAGERLQQRLNARPFEAAGKIVRRLDRLATRLCDLLVSSRGTPGC